MRRHIIAMVARLRRPRPDGYAVGDRFGPYDERIVRIERVDAGGATPVWFDAKANANHVALHYPDKAALYLETTLNIERRAAAHPFDITVKPRATLGPHPVSLFGEPDA